MSVLIIRDNKEWRYTHIKGIPINEYWKQQNKGKRMKWEAPNRNGKNKRILLTPEEKQNIINSYLEGTKISVICRSVGIYRQKIVKLLKDAEVYKRCSWTIKN